MTEAEQMREAALLPCPFCGGEPMTYQLFGKTCIACKDESCPGWSVAAELDNWNRRALPVDPAPLPSTLGRIGDEMGGKVAEAARVLLDDLLNREESDIFEVAQDAFDADEDGPHVLFAALRALAGREG